MLTRLSIRDIVLIVGAEPRSASTTLSASRKRASSPPKSSVVSAPGCRARRPSLPHPKNVLDKGKRVATRVSELATANRREKIARMLAGTEITEQARAERLMAPQWGNQYGA